MNPIRKFKWFMFSCVFLFTFFDVDSKTLIHAGKLIDGKSDRVQSRISIVVDGNTIADIQEGFISSNDFENYIDLRNHTVLPGLMDMHVHFGGEYLSKAESPLKVEREMEAILATQHALVTFKSGFTTVRQVGDSGLVAISLEMQSTQARLLVQEYLPQEKQLLQQEGMLIPQTERHSMIMLTHCPNKA